MKTEEIPVFSIGMLDAASDAFWLGELSNLSKHYFQLSNPGKLRCHMIVFVDRGIVDIIVDGESMNLEEGSFGYIRAGGIVSLDFDSNTIGKCLCFTETFLSGKYNNGLADISIFQQLHINVKLSDSWQYDERRLLLEFMLIEFQNQKSRVNSVLRSYLNILLCKLDRELSNRKLTSGTNIPIEKIQQFKSLLDKHFATHRTASYYASQLNISANYLNKLCKSQEGMSCGDMIRARTIVEAQRLLHYTTLSVVEVAQRLEFESSSYFITFFKRNVGITPDSFRKNNKK